MYVSKPCILSWKWNINAQTWTLIFYQKSYFRCLLSVYVCLKSLCFIDQNCSNIHAQQLSCLNNDANWCELFILKHTYTKPNIHTWNQTYIHSKAQTYIHDTKHTDTVSWHRWKISKHSGAQKMTTLSRKRRVCFCKRPCRPSLRRLGQLRGLKEAQKWRMYHRKRDL